MARPYVQTSSAVVVAIGAASVQVTAAMVARKGYQFIATTNCWIKQGVGAQTAAANTAGNIYVPANMRVELNGSNGTNLSVIQDTAGGQANFWGMTDL